MAEWSGFFDAHKVGDSWDRTYLAEDFAKFLAPLIGNGIFAGRSNELQVFQAVPAGMSVVLSSGQSWIEGYGYINDSDLSIPVDPADGALGRIDRIVNQWSSVDRRIRTVWKKGTPAVNPVAPPLQWNADYKELNICTLNITAGLSAITQDKIHDTRMDSSVCGWVTSLIEQVDTSTLYVQWEAQARIVLDAIQKELAELNEPLESGYSRAQMGSRRVKELQAELKSLKQIEYKKGYEFKRLSTKIKNKGTSDYEMRKSIVYRENYIEEMKKYSHFEGYEQLMEKLESIKNPIDFFDFVSKNELTQDLTYQSDEFYSQQEFLAYVEVMLAEDETQIEDAVSVYNEIKEQNEMQNLYFFE